jgi:hypothetical protein
MFGGSFGREIRIASKYWEIIADNLSRAGWSWGCVRRNRNRSLSLTETEQCLATRRKTIT